jgi:ABC-type nitrate/sulfonate/bicarbonate transport system ATPase subunit
MIELRDVSHTYTTERGAEVVLTRAVDAINMTVPKRQFVSLVGPSGSGKTTLLRLVAGLMKPTHGEILVDGRPIEGPGPDRAIVFQHSGLYPWRTVEANVRLGLELSGIASGEQARAIVHHHLQRVGLAEFADHHPSQLSGGMQQRVGLARALAVQPATLLMDEPFGSVDAITRRRLGAELLRIWEHDQRTVVFVTHSIDEALTLSDRVLLIKEGELVREMPVEIPRPRDPDRVIDEPEFIDLRRSLWELL